MPSSSTPDIEAFADSLERDRAQAYDPAPHAATLTAAAGLPAVRVVAEGDSWFSYMPPNDVLSCLRTSDWGDRRYRVHDRAKAGGLLNDMVYGRDMVDTYELLRAYPPDVFLFSGGGNDIAGPELFCMLHHRQAVLLNGDLPAVNHKALHGIVTEVVGGAYRDLVRLIRIQAARIGKPELPIVLHGYDYAIPDGRGWGWFQGAGPFPGPWLDPSLTRKGYDREEHAGVRQQIVVALIDAFNAAVAEVAASNPHVHHVDLRGTLVGVAQWANELHPTREGFRAVTQKIESRIRAVTP